MLDKLMYKVDALISRRDAVFAEGFQRDSERNKRPDIDSGERVGYKKEKKR
jgi:hypothetical protein